MKRRLAVVLLLAGVVSLGAEATQGSGATIRAADPCPVKTGDCDDEDWICGDSYEEDGKKYQDCYCPLNGLWIRRPAF